MALQTVPLSLCKCLNCRINLSRVCMFVCDCVCVCAHCFSQEWQHKLMTDERLFNPVETRRNTLDNNWELKPCRVIITQYDYHSKIILFFPAWIWAESLICFSHVSKQSATDCNWKWSHSLCTTRLISPHIAAHLANNIMMRWIHKLTELISPFPLPHWVSDCCACSIKAHILYWSPQLRSKMTYYDWQCW